VAEAWQQQEQAREQKAQQDLASVSRELNSARAKLAEAQRLSKELASQFAATKSSWWSSIPSGSRPPAT
jgi:hypothetical protein